MINEAHIENTIKQVFDNIEFSKEPKGLYEPLKYIIELGGKRLRPRLCLTTYAIFKDEFNTEIIEPAVGIEVFHNFTLIHDDIMDNSPLRRGKETIWKKWDSDTAILSGDVMCIDSYKRIAKAPVAVLDKVLNLFNKTTTEVCEGQQYDKDFESRKEVSMDEYMQMIGLKTAVLIACAAKMGALIGGADEATCDKIYEYGYNMGLAFQITDDYLDNNGNVSVLGKPIGGDIINNKKCWLTTRALEKANESQKNEIFEAMEMPISTEEERKAKIERVTKIYDELNINEDAKKEILRLNEKALESAAEVCDGAHLELLKNFADSLIGRNK